jgi:hypothetical protein
MRVQKRTKSICFATISQKKNSVNAGLASRHLDLFEAGDPLSAFKGAMLSVALSWKHSLKK